METVNECRWALSLYAGDGTPLGHAAVAADWEPAVECTRFQFLRNRELPHGTQGKAAIVPLWDREAGEPWIRGFRVAITRNGARALTSDFTTAFFRRLARQAAAQLIEKGKLQEGDQFRYRVAAFQPERGEQETPETPLVSAVETDPSWNTVPSPLAQYLDNARAEGTVDRDDMPVFIPRAVLSEAEQLTRQRAAVETGGVLIGHLHQDDSLPEIFAVVTAQIPVEHTTSTATQLTFTAETWAAVNAAIRLRGRAECTLGYWHSHPLAFWCKEKECTTQKQKTCSMAQGFFSADDELVLRAVFPRAYNVGLLATDTPLDGVRFSLFGWREGGIERRGFYIPGGNSDAA